MSIQLQSTKNIEIIVKIIVKIIFERVTKSRAHVSYLVIRCQIKPIWSIMEILHTATTCKMLLRLDNFYFQP